MYQVLLEVFNYFLVNFLSCLEVLMQKQICQRNICFVRFLQMFFLQNLTNIIHKLRKNLERKKQSQIWKRTFPDNTTNFSIDFWHQESLQFCYISDQSSSLYARYLKIEKWQKIEKEIFQVNIDNKFKRTNFTAWNAESSNYQTFFRALFTKKCSFVSKWVSRLFPRFFIRFRIFKFFCAGSTIIAQCLPLIFIWDAFNLPFFWKKFFASLVKKSQELTVIWQTLIHTIAFTFLYTTVLFLWVWTVLLDKNSQPLCKTKPSSSVSKTMPDILLQNLTELQTEIRKV